MNVVWRRFEANGGADEMGPKGCGRIALSPSLKPCSIDPASCHGVLAQIRVKLCCAITTVTHDKLLYRAIPFG